MFFPVIHMFFSPGLGDGWAPAIISSLTELKFIRANTIELSNHYPFFLGGSTNIGFPQNIYDFDYLEIDTGTQRETLEPLKSIVPHVFFSDNITCNVICKAERKRKIKVAS